MIIGLILHGRPTVMRRLLIRSKRRVLIASDYLASFFFGVRIRLGMNFNYLILWVRVKGQGLGFG